MQVLWKISSGSPSYFMPTDMQLILHIHQFIQIECMEDRYSPFCPTKLSSLSSNRMLNVVSDP